MSLPDFIFDRNYNDLEYAINLRNRIKSVGFDNLTDKEKQEWLNGLKGAYNYTDLNRVETASQEISDLLNDNGFSMEISTKTDWKINDLDGADDKIQMERYLGNVKKISSSLPYIDFDLPEDMNRIDYIDANNIEICLKSIYDTILNIKESIIHCGDIYAGELQ
jgi:hypothetical protein